MCVLIAAIGLYVLAYGNVTIHKTMGFLPQIHHVDNRITARSCTNLTHFFAKLSKAVLLTKKKAFLTLVIL